MEVVGSLCQNSSPIYGINGSELESLVDLGIREEGFYNILVKIQYCLTKNLT